MDKIAALAKEAEVRGVLAAYVDQGLLKVASAEGFDALSGAVAQNLSDSGYTIADIATVTDQLLAGAGNEKIAAELEDTARMAALGELLMKKMAGEIDTPTFAEEAAYLAKEAANDNLPVPVRPGGPLVIPKNKGWLGKIPTKALLGAGIGAGVLAGGLLGKKLLEKHRARQQAELAAIGQAQ